MQKKYVLRQDFKKGFGSRGSKPVYFDKKKGDVVRGTIINDKYKTTPTPIFLRVPFTIKGGNIRFIDIPFRILYEAQETQVPITNSVKEINQEKIPFEGADENTELNKDNTSTIFTLKNIVIGVVGIAVVYGILKVTKVVR